MFTIWSVNSHHMRLISDTTTGAKSSLNLNSRTSKKWNDYQRESMVMVIKHPARLVAEALVLILLLVLAEVAAADHSWGPYHWARTSNPFTLKLGDNVNSTWDGHLDTASFDWSQSAVLDTTIVAGSTDPRRCKPKSGRIEVCNAKYGFNGWLGIAQIWITSGVHIYQGTAKMNDSYFNTSTYNSPAWRQMVMCQEIAHDFGLDHQDEAFDNPNLGTCMDYTSNPSGPPSNEHPNQHDYDQLLAIYDPQYGGHLDSSTTIANSTPAGVPMPPAVSDIDLDSPREWGRLVRSSNGGRTETYERDLGHGRKLATHVIWAF